MLTSPVPLRAHEAITLAIEELLRVAGRPTGQDRDHQRHHRGPFLREHDRPLGPAARGRLDGAAHRRGATEVRVRYRAGWPALVLGPYPMLDDARGASSFVYWKVDALPELLSGKSSGREVLRSVRNSLPASMPKVR